MLDAIDAQQPTLAVTQSSTLDPKRAEQRATRAARRSMRALDTRRATLATWYATLDAIDGFESLNALNLRTALISVRTRRTKLDERQASRGEGSTRDLTWARERRKYNTKAKKMCIYDYYPPREPERQLLRIRCIKSVDRAHCGISSRVAKM
jgi:hypothetical protein